MIAAEVWQKTTKFCKAKIKIKKCELIHKKKKKELSFDCSTVIQNLKQIGKVKNPISGCLMSWPGKKKIIIFKCDLLLFYVQWWTISPLNCDMRQKVDFIGQPTMTSSVTGLRRKLQNTSHSQTCTKKRPRLLVVAADLIHCSFLSPHETITSEKYVQQIDEINRKLQRLQPALVNRKGLVLYDSARLHWHNECFKSWNWATRFSLIHHI